MNSAKDRFQKLVQRLQVCPTLNPGINPKLLFETWSAFRRLDPEHGDEVTPALLVALILFDVESFADLLTEAQLDQLHLVAGQAMQQYELAIKPKNQVGQLLATTIKD
jgi:hypothetical protein